MYTFLSTDTVGPDLIAPAPVKMATNHSPLSLDYALEIMPIKLHIGVVFSFIGSLVLQYCRTGFDSNSLTAAKIATENYC